MTNIEILAAFETEIGKIDNELEKPVTDDSLYWLNLAISKFVKLRFNGDPAHKTSFEQTEKRRVDLDGLIATAEFVNDDNQYDVTTCNAYEYINIVYPEDFLYILSEVAFINIGDKKDDLYTTSVFECTQDSYMYRITNSLTDFHLRFGKARPIRVRTNNGCKLYTDTKYHIYKYTISYIRKPSEIQLGDDAYKDYVDFDDSTLYEIIKMAAQMYLENTGDKRYQTITAEVNTQE